MKKNLIFIPARYKSRRFPGKLLKKFQGNTMLEIIAEKVLKINFNPVIVSGDKEIIIHANKKNYLNIKSKKKHISGMSRVSEVINSKSPKIVFILFGDELYLTEKQINRFIITYVINFIGIFNWIFNDTKNTMNNIIYICKIS